MSIFGSLTTAVLGLTAQSRSLGHISDNIANSSTVGYKRVNTAFETLVLQSNSRIHAPGGVIAQPVFMNNVQGNLTQVQTPTNIAIQGQGFFSVTKVEAASSAALNRVVQTQTGTLSAGASYYTRQGDFELDKNRYLVNSSGFALNGWVVDDITGELRKDIIKPIQVSSLIDRPTPTTNIDLSANLPNNPTGKIPTQQIQIFDAQGNQRAINLDWRQDGANGWRLAIDAPGSSALPVDGMFAGAPATISFGQNVPGVTPVAQINSVTISGQTTNGQDNLRIGETYTVTLDNNTYSLKITEDNIGQLRTFSGVAGSLANQINSATPAAPVMATVDGSTIRLVARNPGTGFKVTQSVSQGTVTNNTALPPVTTDPSSTTGQTQRITFPQTAIDVGDVFSVRVRNNGVDQTINVTVTAAAFATYANISGVVQELANRINAITGLNVTASSAGGVLSIQDKVAGDTFDLGGCSASVTNSSAAANTIAGSFSQTNVTGIRQQRTVTLTGAVGDVGTVYTLNVNGTPVSYTTTGEELSMEEISAAMANTINSNTSLPVTASSQGGVITLVAKKASGDPAEQFTLEQTTVTGQTPAYVGLTFGTSKDNVALLTSISTALVGNGTAVSSPNQNAGDAATLTFTVNYGFGNQTVSLNLGNFQRLGGLSQYSGNTMTVGTFVQDGAGRGQFKEVVFGDSGNVLVNYDNGRSKVIARVPIVTFNNPNAMQREAGGVFIETDETGKPNFNDPETNGAGAVVASSVESSNVDIADEFTKLIVTQRSYSANTKIVTTSDEMLQEVLNLKR